MMCGPEFGPANVGKRALMKRALCGGKAAGRDFRNHLRSCMAHLNFKSCLADPDDWMRPATKADGQENHEFTLLCTDDVLCISENPETTIQTGVGKHFELKEESMGPPKTCLRGHLRKVTLENGAKAWSFGLSQCVQASMKNVEDCVSKRGWKSPNKSETPITTT